MKRATPLICLSSVIITKEMLNTYNSFKFDSLENISGGNSSSLFDDKTLQVIKRTLLVCLDNLSRYKSDYMFRLHKNKDYM